MGKLRKSGVAPVEWEFLYHDSCLPTWNGNPPGTVVDPGIVIPRDRQNR